MPDISHEDLCWLGMKLASAKFVFAKTMPKIPHFYTVGKDWDSFDDFIKACDLVKAHGVSEVLWRFPPRNYLYVGPWRYWPLPEPPQTYTVLNRCDPNNPIYKGHIRRV